ncbi:unnamed protein product [Musa acuminata subsp. malaccensis]|uniref:(wild Malaysian banana) hypothetical protein n=1 Tax=Musa acuminata subsp. malaccensis TaxID=214687 RepID=A0A804I8C5_MUSAM|nr:unnamed protein product [Musa acuminata subsp. malaccensis]
MLLPSLLDIIHYWKQSYKQLHRERGREGGKFLCIHHEAKQMCILKLPTDHISKSKKLNYLTP